MTLPFDLSATAYDPLEDIGGSIDPLGYQAGYIAVADMYLPGFTTITQHPRYMSVLCAGFLLVEQEGSRASGTSDNSGRWPLKASESWRWPWPVAMTRPQGDTHGLSEGTTSVKPDRRNSPDNQASLL